MAIYTFRATTRPRMCFSKAKAREKQQKCHETVNNALQRQEEKNLKLKTRFILFFINIPGSKRASGPGRSDSLTPPSSC